MQQPEVGVAWPGQGSSEDKKEGTDANITEEEDTEGGAVCHRSTRGGRVKDGFEVAGTWDHSDQSGRWKRQRRHWFVGKAVRFGVRHLFIEAHALPGLDQAVVSGEVGGWGCRKTPDWCS